MTDDLAHDRLPLLEPPELTAEQRAVYDAIGASRRRDERRADSRSAHVRPVPALRWVDDEGRLLGPFNAMLYSPAVGQPLQRLGAALRFATAFTPREREIATLVVAAHRRSDFEWYAHERIGRGAGLTEEELAALRTGRAPRFTDPREHTVYEAARALAVAGDLDDARFDEAVAVLGRPLLVELVTLVGYYTALAQQLRVFRVGLPPGEPGIDWESG
ncbi:MAG TPA: carboxymuconolactone decarboxylase family protein [Streptosporangiaceae bacterium]|nr:carboxymuconolactone decarboxylase family protein [Streptosporangiaceae bacterium]